VVVSAYNTAFEQQSVTAPSGVEFTIWFENRENVLHNVHVFSAPGASIAQGELFTGPGAQPLSVPALAAGTIQAGVRHPSGDAR